MGVVHDHAACRAARIWRRRRWRGLVAALHIRTITPERAGVESARSGDSDLWIRTMGVIEVALNQAARFARSPAVKGECSESISTKSMPADSRMRAMLRRRIRGSYGRRGSACLQLFSCDWVSRRIHLSDGVGDRRSVVRRLRRSPASMSGAAAFAELGLFGNRPVDRVLGHAALQHFQDVERGVDVVVVE